jgi:hypothetical protein
VNHGRPTLSSFSLITEIRTIQLSNSLGGITFKGVPAPTNCVPFDRSRGRSARDMQAARDVSSRAERLTDIFDHLSPAQYAFLSGVLAILAEHGEEALTKSCEMVIERFGRHAG